MSVPVRVISYGKAYRSAEALLEKCRPYRTEPRNPTYPALKRWAKLCRAHGALTFALRALKQRTTPATPVERRTTPWRPAVKQRTTSGEPQLPGPLMA